MGRILVQSGIVASTLKCFSAFAVFFIFCYLWSTLTNSARLGSESHAVIVEGLSADKLIPREVDKEERAEEEKKVNSEESVESEESVDEKSCEPKQHFMFSKIEKTGSSTLYGIFSRYVKTNSLNLMVQTVGYHMNTSAPRGATPGWDIGPRANELADVWIDHGAFNNTLVTEYMHKDTILIACVREPVGWFKSATTYFHHTKHMTPDQLLNNKVELYRDRLEIATYLHLNQLLWLGFDYKQRNNIAAIENHVKFLNKRFDVIMLNDEFDASIVLMRRRLCWSYSDIFYRSNIVTNSGRRTMTAANIKTLLSAEVNLGEKILYDTFNATWWSQPEVKDVEFWEEVKYFKKRNQEVRAKCQRGTTFTLPSSKWHEELTVTAKACTLMAMSPIPMYVSTARYAIGTKYIPW